MTLEAAKILARVRQCGRSLASWDPGAVHQLVRALGVSIRSTADGRIIADGPADVVEAIAGALRVHRAALMAGDCSQCHHNLAASPGELCRWCGALGARSYVYGSGSIAERSYLAASRLRASEPRGSGPL